MINIKPPTYIKGIPKFSVFLAGSIEMGKAEDWQIAATKRFENLPDDVFVYNPRRDDWDSSWEQSINNPQFKEQVEWELDHLSHATCVLMYLQPGTQSPISLLELGLHARNLKLFVVCPEGFWRKGNVDIVCNQYGIPQFETTDAAIDAILAEYWRMC